LHSKMRPCVSVWLMILPFITHVLSQRRYDRTTEICENDEPYINNMCKFWAKRGDCISNPTVARECQAACKPCNRGECANDVDAICDAVAEEGQCERAVVRAHCSKACNSCGEKTSPANKRGRPDRRRTPRPTAPTRTRRPNRKRLEEERRRKQEERRRQEEEERRRQEEEEQRRREEELRRAEENRRKPTSVRPTEYPRGEETEEDVKSKLSYELRTCFSEFYKPGDHCSKSKTLFLCAYSIIYGEKSLQGVTDRMRDEFESNFKSVFAQFVIDDCDFTFQQLKRKFMKDVRNRKSNGNCKEKPVDIMYLIDTSSSINSKNPMAYMQALDFAASLLDHFDFHHGNTRVAAIQFANGIFPYHAIEFNEKKEKVQEDIRDLIYLPGLHGNWMAGSYSHIWKGLDYMREEFLPMCRPRATQVAIVLTDGLSNPQSGKTQEAAKKAKEAGVKLIAVGIGTAHGKDFQRELEDIAGSRANVFRVNDYSVQPRISQRVKETSCDEPQGLREKIPYGPPVFDA